MQDYSEWKRWSFFANTSSFLFPLSFSFFPTPWANMIFKFTTFFMLQSLLTSGRKQLLCAPSSSGSQAQPFLPEESLSQDLRACSESLSIEGGGQSAVWVSLWVSQHVQGWPLKGWVGKILRPGAANFHPCSFISQRTFGRRQKHRLYSCFQWG